MKTFGEKQVFDRIQKLILALALIASLGSAQQPKTAKDQAESDLYTNISGEKDPAKKLGLLDQWTEKYPDTAFKEERNLFYVQAYSALAGLGMQANATPDQLSAAEKADHTLIDKADTFFAPDVKMASVKAEDWAKAKTVV